MTIPGIGPIVGLSFIAHMDDATRFRKTADVGAFLGLTPRRHQSGEVDYSGRISKCGDVQMRGLLFEAATSLIRLVKRFSPLKACAERLTARTGFKKCRSSDSPKNGSADADALEKRNRILLERNRYSLKRYNEIPPKEEAGSKVPKGRSQIDLVGAVGAENVTLDDPAHDIWDNQPRTP